MKMCIYCNELTRDSQMMTPDQCCDCSVKEAEAEKAMKDKETNNEIKDKLKNYTAWLFACEDQKCNTQWFRVYKKTHLKPTNVKCPECKKIINKVHENENWKYYTPVEMIDEVLMWADKYEKDGK